nr:MAG TPA: Major capsid protein [Microviridae sp.]
MTRLNNYNRSTHDKSFVCRTSMAPGVLTPTMKELLLPGDTYPIQTRCHILTHPTVGPLFGSFKQQNDFFFCPIRLYNAMLHNNALNIGLNMKQVKFPNIQFEKGKWDIGQTLKGSNGSLKNEVNPSSLPAYLGVKSLTRRENEKDICTIPNAVPFLAYYDIFKNYYANKQEEKFYAIAGAQAIRHANNTTTFNSFYFTSFEKIGNSWINTSFIISNPNTTPTQIPQNNVPGFIIRDNDIIDLNQVYLTDSITILPVEGSLSKIDLNTKSIAELIGEGILEEVKNLPTVNNERYFIFKPWENETETRISVSIPTAINMASIGAQYKSYFLEEIDQMRETILQKGKMQYNAYEENTFIQDIFKSQIDFTGDTSVEVPNSIYPMTGLLLKTYQSDINTNWVNTEWLDGDSGINSITAIDTSGGSFTLDTLNLAKKVYTMLNRIAVSDGSYNAWIQTVYTSGGLNHMETPLYLGGSSLEIEFQEVVNNSGTEDQPLGTLAGRGVATSHKGGNIVFKADEPGYIMCISSITPRVDYFQGNEWDMYLESIDDLHKPQLDGIGFQDRLYEFVNGSCPLQERDLSIGKQPAWIEYMTNVNKTYGNFALIENEGWMCLNRIFGDIDTYTTYVFPHLYNNIFADTSITSQNFWVQIAFNMKPRRVMSAKVIPNI